MDEKNIIKYYQPFTIFGRIEKTVTWIIFFKASEKLVGWEKPVKRRPEEEAKVGSWKWLGAIWAGDLGILGTQITILKGKAQVSDDSFP